MGSSLHAFVPERVAVAVRPEQLVVPRHKALVLHNFQGLQRRLVLAVGVASQTIDAAPLVLVN